MKRATQIGYILSLSLVGMGASTSFASCPDKIDPQFCDWLNEFNDTDWVGCMVGLKLQPPDSQVTDPTKDSTIHHTSTPPPPYLIAEVGSLFTNYELRWPDTLTKYRLAPYPVKTRATVPSPVQADYEVFIRKRDVLSLGTKEYIGAMWAWLPPAPDAVTPFRRNDLKSLYQGNAFNLNGQRVNIQKYLSIENLKLKQ